MKVKNNVKLERKLEAISDKAELLKHFIGREIFNIRNLTEYHNTSILKKLEDRTNKILDAINDYGELLMSQNENG